MFFGNRKRLRKSLAALEAEHRSGWAVYRKEKLVCKLIFVDEPNLGQGVEFKVTEERCDREELEYLLNSAMRSPLADVFFINLRTQRRVDDKFFTGSIEVNTAWVRDFRAP